MGMKGNEADQNATSSRLCQGLAVRTHNTHLLLSRLPELNKLRASVASVEGCFSVAPRLAGDV